MRRASHLQPDDIYQGDALDLLPRISSATVRLVHTSPPYNIGRGYNAYEDSKPRQEYLDFIREVVTECFRALVPGGSMFWQTGYTSDADSTQYIYPLDHLTFDLFLKQGFRLKDRVVWRYFGGMAFKRKFTNKHETILWWVKPGADTVFNVFPVRERSKELDARNNLFGRNPGNVWEVDRVAYGATEQSSHIAVFPEEISERIILSCSEPGDVCLDPFSGSGTVCKVAKARGRRYLGIEISEKYVGESRIRLGFCQDNEFDNVLSQLLKDRVFGKEAVSLSVDEIVDRLLRAIHNGSGQSGPWPLDEDDLVRVLQLEENGISKSRKIVIWKRLDEYLASSLRGDPIRLVDSAYLSSFRLNRVYNSVMRYALARRWLEEFMQIAANKAGLAKHIQGLSPKEPSSYRVRGRTVTLVTMNRDIKAAESAGIRLPERIHDVPQLDLTLRT